MQYPDALPVLRLLLVFPVVFFFAFFSHCFTPSRPLFGYTSRTFLFPFFKALFSCFPSHFFSHPSLSLFACVLSFSIPMPHICLVHKVDFLFHDSLSI